VPAVRGLSSPFYLTHNAIEVSTLRLLTGFCPVLISFLQKFMNTSATRNVRESLEEIDIRTALNLRKFERCERYQAALAVRLDSLAINIEDFAIYIATERFFALLIPCKSANPVSKDAPPPFREYSRGESITAFRDLRWIMVRVPFPSAPPSPSRFLRASGIPRLCDGTCGLCRPLCRPRCERIPVLAGDTTKSSLYVNVAYIGTSTIRFGTASRNTHTNAGHSGVNGFNGMEVIRPPGFYLEPSRG